MHNLAENISSKIAFSLCESKDKSSEEFYVLKYGAFAVVHTTIGIIMTILFGMLTNTLFEIVTISIIGAWLKRFSGGAHCTSANRCVVTGIIVSYIFALLSKNIINLQIEIVYIIEFITLINIFIILYKKCPVGSPNKPLKREETRKKLRKKSFFMYLVCLILFILNILLNSKSSYTNLNLLVLCIILSLYMQALSLTSIGNNIILFLDKVLLKFKI